MFPEVPIALRMSGHLLLGIIRIYSKKVDYLYHDCNVVLIGIRKAFASIDVNLPEDATHAMFRSVTLPETFELDALDLDDELNHDGVQDNHLRSREEITITDQIPVEGDLYVAFDINADIRMDISSPVEIPEIRVRPMEEDVLPSLLVESCVGVTGPSNQAEEFSEMLHEDHFPQNLPEIEVMRDAVHNFGPENLPVWPDLGKESTEQNSYLDQTINEKETLSQVMDDIPVSGGQSLPFQLHPDPPPSVSSEEAPENFYSRISLGHISHELVIQPTPPVEKPKPRPRKRKQLYDESPVLTNKFMKKAIEDPSDLFRKKNRCPSSALDVWKFNNSSRKEQIFFEPSICGLCTNIQNISKKDFISSKPHLVPIEDALPEHTDAQCPTPMPDLYIDIEHLRHEEGHAGISILPEFMPYSSMFMPSPSRRDDFTPFSANKIVLEPQMGTTVRTEVLLTPDTEASTGPVGPGLETPLTLLQEQLGVEDTCLSDIPELLNSAEAEDLNFLEADNTPAGNEEVDALSVRTRAVAQYLKRKSPATHISEDQSGNLSLNKILEGKTRKLCARMFFETLVLKSCGLIDVQQQEAYGDITLELTPTLSKAQF